MKTSRFFLYGHGGSGNHGCEAIVRSTVSFLHCQEVVLLTNGIEQDLKYKLDSLCVLKSHSKKKYLKYSFKRLAQSLVRRITGDIAPIIERDYENLFSNIDQSDIAISIGGDNYCFGSYPKILGVINKSLNTKEIKTVLWGCSIEPALLCNKEIVDDMRRYSLITARESITYDALINAGILENAYLFPDPAFCLETIIPTLPKGFALRHTIGINLSKLIQNYEGIVGITIKNIHVLLEYIIGETDFQIALIPHVVWENNNDLEQLSELYEHFKDTGRVLLVGDHNCMELKGIISLCRMFIGARTHAIIAAYSSCVPTIALGYSVKAKGIAKDIFGDYKNYVIPVDNLKTDREIKDSFQWLLQNEFHIRSHLENVMPDYIEKTKSAGVLLNKLIEGKF